MRLLLASTAIALMFGLSPASAMCGGDQQAGGMCGAPAASKNMSEKNAAEWPVAPGAAQSEQKQSGMGAMCPCCKNMAMMKGDGAHKGMEMPKQ